MKSSVPIVRQIAWICLVPQMGFLAILILAIHIALRPADPAQSFLTGAVIYLVLSRVLRRTVAADHARGISLMKRGNFSEAIPFFERSYVFFTRHPWIDRWRFISLLSGSAISYREMALCNIAFAHSQLGDGAKAKEHYRRALAEFPASGIATASLRMFEAAETASSSRAEPG
jgi:tetratricopeptide (TPR) repeat protein